MNLSILAAALIPGAPLAACLFFLLIGFARGLPGEVFTRRLVWTALLASAASVGFLTIKILESGESYLHLTIGSLFALGTHQFEIAMLLDELSIVMSCTVTMIAILVTRFATVYLHREEGFGRFFLLLCLCAGGLQTIVLAASYDFLFMGWELVGLSSVLLIAFFPERAKSVRGAMTAFATYRVADVGILVGAVVLHAAAGTTDYEAVFDHTAWPSGHVLVQPGTATLVAVLLLFAAMGKSAQYPLGGWLPRAMEGPTPSSALFYGALSVHAGLYLLLRSEPLLRAAPLVAGLAVVVGASTAAHATFVGRVQADAKSQLAYATMGQLGVILIEIGLGFSQLALLHIVGHAFLRGYQLLRAPSILADVARMRAALALSTGADTSSAIRHFAPERALPDWAAWGLFRAALDRFFYDAFVERIVQRPLFKLAALLSGEPRGAISTNEGNLRPSLMPPPLVGPPELEPDHRHVEVPR